MSWIKKLMNTFFDDENDDDYYYEEEQEEQPVKKKRFSEENNATSKTRPAAFTNNGKRTVQTSIQHPAKMLHKYPENAPFRFPVIPDEKTMKSSPQRHTYQPRETSHYKEPVRQERSYREERSVREERPQNRENRRLPGKSPDMNSEQKRPAFKATHVPSPVYGFERRDKNAAKQTNETKEVSSEVKSRFTPTDVPSPVYGFGKRKPEGILFIGRDIPQKDSVTEELLKTVEETLPAGAKEKLIALEENREIIPSDLHDSAWKQEQEIEHVAEAAPRFNVQQPDEQIQQHYTPNEVRTESEIVPDQIQKQEQDLAEEPSQGTEPISSNERFNDELQVQELDQLVEEVEEKKVYNDESTFVEDEHRTASPPKRESAKSGGQYVPFNVLMLKKDRKTYANKVQPQPENKPAVPSLRNDQEKVSNGENQLFVPLSFLNKAKVSLEDDDLWLNEQRQTLQSTLDNFNVNAKVVHMTKGPAVTRFEVQPAPGVKVNKITNLTDDIKLSLAARDIRIEAPIPGKNAIGIEVPNQHSRAVFLREIIEHDVFKESASSLTVALGLDISGAPVVTDLQKMPHGLIAGATGSGKSVCINSILVSLLYKAKPEDVRLLLVDPKMVELAPYNHIPHLVTPVITDAKEATAALKWAVEEMERRYEEFAKTGVREIKRYNQKMEEERHYQNKMPYIVVVIDELADLMMVSPQEVEEAICRIAQKARACGIHLLLATQRPSVDVITGLIKANVPTRTAFAVSSAIDSRTILDMSGAERLLGRGDMLFMENGSNKAVRIQGTFVSDEEIEEVTRYVKEEYQTDYLFTREELIQHQQTTEVEDELFEEACFYVIEVGAASSSSLQRRFRIGYNRAARLVDMMEGFGLVSEAMGSKPRHVLLTHEELENRLYSQVD
ncbi:DNA translocase FtsK [Fictibacillus barbaricus]|uniref:DNA translocase FtsK n=1 Tax=Fictibacillus barbaricus TaxID=182136 RepID=A0ABS2ZIX9_9BACL|nr:DNA translocase FtsK [Fictibacillus barbaricus]MBN3547303.1 DNA translocase FtsK [Fictibacillus barbaricus]GGB47984.1 DNA translocase SftA [Fictibacillus barbaricus]